MKKWRVMNREAICLQLADKINHLKNNDKIISERLAGIRLLYGVEPGPRTPVMYQPGIIFLFSGHKIGYINKRKFRYDANEYLLLTVPLPFECETWATPEVPLAGIRLDIDVLQRHCCKVSDEAAFCLIQRPYISKTLLTRRISPRGSP